LNIGIVNTDAWRSQVIQVHRCPEPALNCNVWSNGSPAAHQGGVLSHPPNRPMSGTPSRRSPVWKCTKPIAGPGIRLQRDLQNSNVLPAPAEFQLFRPRIQS